MDLCVPYTSTKPLEFTASGIPSLDAIIGGGFPVGSLILLNEDTLGTYSDMFLKIFIAQGIVKNDDIIFGSCHVSANRFMRTLPQESSSNVNSFNVTCNERLQIAWRYENNPVLTSMDSNKSATFSSSFHFKDHLSDEIINSANIDYWPSKGSPATYEDLLECIHNRLTTTDNLNELLPKKKDKSILRIAIHNLGSLFWKEPQNRLPQFLYHLRALLHHSHAVAFITFPKHLIEKAEIISRCEQMSDSVIELVSFGKDKNPLYSELNGFIRFNKLCALNSLCPLMIDAKDWAFKLSLKKIIIEKLRLPPESAASVQREQEVSTRPFCNQTDHKLDF